MREEYDFSDAKKVYFQRGNKEFVVSNGKGQSASGTSITSFGNSCGSANNVYLAPPEWYTGVKK